MRQIYVWDASENIFFIDSTTPKKRKIWLKRRREQHFDAFNNMNTSEFWLKRRRNQHFLNNRLTKSKTHCFSLRFATVEFIWLQRNLRIGLRFTPPQFKWFNTNLRISLHFTTCQLHRLRENLPTSLCFSAVNPFHQNLCFSLRKTSARLLLNCKTAPNSLISIPFANPRKNHFLRALNFPFKIFY